MTVPAFERVAGQSRLYRLTSSAEAGVEGWWAGYCCGIPTLGATATLDQVWQDEGGVYLFLGESPAADFVAKLDRAIEGERGVRMAWLPNPAAPIGLWRIEPVAARAIGQGAAIAWSLTHPADFILGDYSVRLDAGTALSQADPAALGSGIAAADGGLNFAGPGFAGAASPGTAWLPLAGDSVGSWCADIAAPADVMARIGALIRFAAPQTDGEEGDPVDTLDAYPFGTAGSAIRLRLRFDPLNPLLAARTRIAIDPLAQGAAAPVFPARFRTSRGYGTSLAPRAAEPPLRSGGLAFGRTPLVVREALDATSWIYHLSPDGAFDLAVLPPPGEAGNEIHRLMPGLSGLEYAGLPGNACVACFVAQRPAFARAAGPQSAPPKPGAPLLAAEASTAHVTFLPPRPAPPPAPSTLEYYAQPAEAPLYAGATGIGSGFLGFHEMPAAALPPWPATGGPHPPVFPAVPFAGTRASSSALASRLERVALAPARRGVLTDPTGLTSVAVTAVTPQGLMVEVSDSGFQRVTFANMPATPAARLSLVKRGDSAAIGRDLQGALQANQLFFVVADPTKLGAQCSVPYRLDKAGLRTAADLGAAPARVTAVGRITDPAAGPVDYADEQALRTAIAVAAGTDLEIFVEAGGFLKAMMSDWVFQLSPSAWRAPDGPGQPGTATVMLVKYAGRPLEDLVADLSAWAWPEAGAMPEGDRADTRTMISAIFADARTRAEGGAPGDAYADFYRDVVAAPGWNGILFLNAPVSIDEFPDGLQFLTAGIDSAKFFAHHVGFSTTPVHAEGSTPQLRQTAAFGLIDYQDVADLVVERTVQFAFKTLSLTARFANAALTGFSARAELMVNRLFDVGLTKLDPTHGNNLVLTGSLQHQNGKPAYAFVLEGANRYMTSGSALNSVELLGVRLTTRSPPTPNDPLNVTFTLSGDLRFGDIPGFDPFSYGPFAPAEGPAEDGHLRFDGLAVTMSKPPGAAPASFSLALAGLRFDTVNSLARSHSLQRNFPLSLDRLVSASSRKPEDLGYVSIAAPIDQTPLPGPWYGLVYTLDLGTLGALSGGKRLTLSLLAAWGPIEGDGDPPVYLGLQLPGGRGGGEWPLQGVIELGFRSFEFSASDEGDRRAYMLRLRKFALSILSLSFPPGNLDVMLVGDPNAAAGAEAKTLAWYAAYGGE